MEEVTEAVVAALGRYAGQAADAVKKLGCEYPLRHRRPRRRHVLKVLCKRVKKALTRNKRVQQLAGSRSSMGVFRAGVAHEALYGAEFSLLAPMQLNALRQAAVRAGKWALPGVPIGLKVLGIGAAADPLFDVNWRAV